MFKNININKTTKTTTTTTTTLITATGIMATTSNTNTNTTSNSKTNNFSEEIKDCLEIDSEDILNLQNNIYKLIIKEKILVKGVSIKKESLEDIFLKEVHKHV